MSAGLLLGLGLSGVALAIWLAKRDAKGDAKALPAGERAAITEAIWTPQTPEGLTRLLQTACGCVAAAPQLADAELQMCVWRAHWEATPYPSKVVEGDHGSVGEALEAVRAAVTAAREGDCEKPEERPADDGGGSSNGWPFPTNPDGDGQAPFPFPWPFPMNPDGDGKSPFPFPFPFPPSPTPPSPEGDESPSSDDDTPQPQPAPIPQPAPAPFPPLIPGPTPTPEPEPGPVDMAALTKEMPRAGFFYQVTPGDTFFGDEGIVALALRAAVVHAAIKKGWSNQKALSHAAAIAGDPKARVAYLGIIQCSPWNDALYCTWGYGKNSFPAAHGRAIRLIPRHDRVYDRLADGEAPIRTLELGVPADKGTGKATGAGDSFELLWLPPLRSDALLDPNRQRQVVAEGLVWPGGSSKYNPPPAVQALGIANAPAGPWGCEGVGS